MLINDDFESILIITILASKFKQSSANSNNFKGAISTNFKMVPSIAVKCE